jgi:translocation and assembly module TamB
MIHKKLAWARWLLSSILIGIFLLSNYLFLNTTRGLEVAVLLGKAFLPGQLKIKLIHGRLLGPIQLKKLVYQDNKINLYVSEAQFDWDWRDLLQGKLKLGSIFIDKLNLFVKQKTSQKKLNSHEKTYRLPKIFQYLKFNSVDIHQINVQSDAINLLLQGSIQQQWNINWQLTIKRLNKLIPNLQGEIALQGKIYGQSQYPKFDVIMEKTNLQWQDWQLRHIQSTLNADIKNKKWFLDLTTTQLNNTLFKFAPLHLKLSGSLSPFSLQGNLSEFKLNKLIQTKTSNYIAFPNIQINSMLSKCGLETSLQTLPKAKNQLFVYLLLHSQQLDFWQGGAKTKQPQCINLHEDCELRSNTDKNSSAKNISNYQEKSLPISNQSLHMNIALSLKDLNFLTQLIPNLKNTKGIFNTEIKITGTFNKPLFQLTLNLQQASLDIPGLGLNLKNINYRLHTYKNNLIGIGQVQSGNGSLEFHTTTDLLKKNLSTLIDLQGKNITLINNPEYQIIATPKLKIQANIRQIETDGTILFPKARIKINSKNNNLIELSDDVVFIGENKKVLTLPFVLKTAIKLEAGNDIQLQYQGLNTKLNGSLTIKQTSEHPVLATGQLKLFPGEYSYYGQTLKLKPNSSLNFANTPINNPIINITASRNSLILPASTPDTSTDIKSELGSNNFIQSALFSSQSIPIQLEIGLNLRGTLQNPKISLFANPSDIVKSKLDMLSYLITGQASNQLSAASTRLLLNAASNLGGEKNNIGQLINKVKQEIGLDQLTIGAKPIFDPITNSLQQNTSLIVGKNLSPKLRLSYSLGLLDQISIIEINYLLNKSFSLQATSSNFANGLDLLYRLEKY